MEFVSFELAKKLKEKGFSCKYPLAMYNERGWFCPLYTSADRNPNIKSVFGNREYYDYDDFDEKDFIAPTIEQVLSWLRKEKQTHFEIVSCACGYEIIISRTPPLGTDLYCSHASYDGPNAGGAWDCYEEAAVAGIEYTLDHLL